jgi:isoleucyl-tRNA synthetase
MDRVREACSVALALREEHGLRTRLPLSSVTLAGEGAKALAGLVHLVRSEVNVKEVVLSDDLEAHGTFVLSPDRRTLGPKLGKAMKDVLAAVRDGTWTLREDGSVEVAGHVLAPGEFELNLRPKEGEVSQALGTGDMVVVLDTHVTPELEAEGYARDVVRKIQQARKEADFDVTDRIGVALRLPGACTDAIRTHEAYVREQVLAEALVYGDPPQAGYVVEDTLAGEPLSITVWRTGSK